MADVKWIKIATGLFSDEKIMLIEQMPEADTILVIWLKLLCMAGRENNNGVFIMNGSRIAYTDEMLAAIFHRPVNTVRLALQVFESYGMIEIDDGIITVPNWEKHQNIDGLDKIKEQTRKRVAKHRQNQKLLESNVTCNGSCNVTVTPGNATDKNRIDKNRKENIVSKDTICSTDVQRVVEAWNSIGITKITGIKQETQRYKMLKARVRDYGIEQVLQAVENVKLSSFLKGNNDKGWEIKFDWFIKPSNFLKVSEGNYSDKGNVQGKKPSKSKWAPAEQREYDFEALEKELLGN